MASTRRNNISHRILSNLNSRMPGSPKATKGVSRRAATMSEYELQLALKVAHDPLRLQPERDALLILLTHRLGLRIGEAAQTCAFQFLDASGNVKDTFFVPAKIAKNGYDRELPIPPATNVQTGDLKRLLIAYMKKYPFKPNSRIFFTPTGEPLSPDTARKQVTAIYEKVGLVNCSSHSGRRSYATRAMKKLAAADNSLRDLQYALGHAFLSTTEKYVERTGNLARLNEIL